MHLRSNESPDSPPPDHGDRSPVPIEEPPEKPIPPDTPNAPVREPGTDDPQPIRFS
ncbi:MAG: hypothetical protein ABI383_10660 [Acidobacteriaceae bacterium]